jgi:CBS-domain-containing membrane protein
MSRSLRKASEALRQVRSVATTVLIGSAITTPAFAATDIVLDDLQLPILIGSLVLLAISLVAKVAQRRRAPMTKPPAAPASGFSEGIGRYRLQLGRGDAD